MYDSPFVYRKGESMNGFIYRLGQRLKDWGEQGKLPWLIRIGLWIRGMV